MGIRIEKQGGLPRVGAVDKEGDASTSEVPLELSTKGGCNNSLSREGGKG